MERIEIRGEAERKREIEKNEEEREQVRYASRDFRYGRRRCGAAWYTRRRTERIRSSVFRSWPERPNRASVARVYSRFLDTDERRGRDRAVARTHEGACTYNTLSTRPENATRDVKRRKGEARGRLAADLARVTPLSKEANREGERCTATRRALPPRAFKRTYVSASGTFRPLMRDTARVRGHFCFHSGMRGTSR